MLASLRIKNLALVDELSLEFPSGYVALTGETGAGKSILIGALKLILGERADRTLVRSGEDSCMVEGVFDCRSLPQSFHELLEERGLEPCDNGQLLLKRTFTLAGANRQFVNGSPTTLQTLNDIGQWLVDLHGPHEHQSLLHAPQQLAVLDAFGGLEEALGGFGEVVQQGRSLLAKKESLIIDEATYARQLDLLQHQCAEIEQARLDLEEDEALPAAYQRAANSARLLELSQAAVSQIGDADPDLLSQMGALGRTLEELEQLDPETESLHQLQQQLAEQLQDLQQELHHYADRVDVDPEQLAKLEERLGVLQSLKRKYGPNLEDVVEFGRNARQELDELQGREGEVRRIDGELQKLGTKALELGKALTGKRRKAIPKLAKGVTEHLKSLGFLQSRFEIALESRMPDLGTDGAFSALTGFDQLEFQFSPNPGEPLRPLRAIASSGEMARVMLAVKSVLAAQDNVPVLIFDEVDANIGGEVANAVGEKMRKLGEQRQVLCITHLAPVAARAQHHFVVSKSVAEGRTLTQVQPLGEEQRVTEISRMLGGQSKTARELASALLTGK
jgi:DNA repair protein RecN (Recombination protein N)